MTYDIKDQKNFLLKSMQNSFFFLFVSATVKKQSSALVSKTLRFDNIVYTCPAMCKSLDFLKLQIELFINIFIKYITYLSDVCYNKLFST